MSWSKSLPLEELPTFKVNILLFAGEKAEGTACIFLLGLWLFIGFAYAAFTRLGPVGEIDRKTLTLRIKIRLLRKACSISALLSF